MEFAACPALTIRSLGWLQCRGSAVAVKPPRPGLNINELSAHLDPIHRPIGEP
jgi:hypothetical protein